MRPVDQLCEMLHQRGQKVTPQRRLIFEVLHDGLQHPSADDIYDTVKEVMPDISVATVYHTINDLLTMGELVELDLGEGKSRYDPLTDQHQHVVCISCRKVQDIPRSVDCVQLLPEEVNGYQIERCDVVFYGRCPECQS